MFYFRNHIDKLGAGSLSQGLGHMHFLVHLKLYLNESNFYQYVILE